MRIQCGSSSSCSGVGANNSATMLAITFSMCVLVSLMATIGHAAPPSLTADEEMFTSSEYYSSSETDLMVTPPPPAVHLDFVYHNYVALTEFLRNVSEQYPHLTHLYSIGQSVQKRELWVLAVSSTPDRHVLGKPEVKYVGNIHGNEPVSKEILLHLILHLVSGYGHDPVITLLLNHSRIHFLASMNPDGFEKSSEGTCIHDKGRRNHREYDLNRNFPDYFQKNALPLQPETIAVMEWMKNVPFVLSAGLHGGALVASYPYENHVIRALHMYTPEEQPTPDDDVFRHLATVYARNHATMWQGKPCNLKSKSDGFPDGIINGAKWYSFTGGMQDYNYIFHGTMEITLEVSCCKHPKAETLRDHWQDNRKALILYMYEALRGVKGFVTDGETGLPLGGVELRVKGREREFNTTDDGEFWRILLNGSYTLQANAEGYEPLEVPFEVMGDEATVLNVTMRRLAVSLSSPSNPSSVSVLGLVEDVLMDSMLTTQSSVFPSDLSAGDGNHSTPDPNNSVDPDSSADDIGMTLVTTISQENSVNVAPDDNDDDPSDDLSDEYSGGVALESRLSGLRSSAPARLVAYGPYSLTHSNFTLMTCTLALLLLTLNHYPNLFAHRY